MLRVTLHDEEDDKSRRKDGSSDRRREMWVSKIKCR